MKTWNKPTINDIDISMTLGGDQEYTCECQADNDTNRAAYTAPSKDNYYTQWNWGHTEDCPNHFIEGYNPYS